MKVSEAGNEESDVLMGAAAEDLRLLAYDLARQYVRRPDLLAVTADRADDRVAVTASPAAGDVGRMAGGGGAMFHATAALLTQAAKRLGVHVHYSIEQPEDSPTRPDAEPFKARVDWPEWELRDAVQKACRTMFDYPTDVRFVNEQSKTRAHVRLDLREPKRMPDAELRDALSTVVHAMGANNGRRIYVETLARRAA